MCGTAKRKPKYKFIVSKENISAPLQFTQGHANESEGYQSRTFCFEYGKNYSLISFVKLGGGGAVILGLFAASEPG